MKIIEEKDQTVPVTEMRDGDIAVITDWSLEDYKGRVVQRFYNYLITLGERSDKSWDALFKGTSNERLRVRILPPGTKLEI